LALASIAKVQKDLRTCPRRLFRLFVLSFFLFLFYPLVVLAKNTQICTAPAEMLS